MNTGLHSPMPELDRILRLVELSCARLCHDLSGLIGTIGNALEMLTEDAGGENEILAFATSASKALMQRLRLHRIAWGPEIDAFSLERMLELAAPPLAAKRIGIDARTLADDMMFSQAMTRVALNLILLASECLPKGGTLVLLGGPDDLFFRIVGPDAAWPAGFAAMMNDVTTATSDLSSARSVLETLTVLFSVIGGLRLSPVLGARAGMEAVRVMVQSAPPNVDAGPPEEN